jgi:hypothetical protein
MTRFVRACFVLRETLVTHLESHQNARHVWLYNPSSRSGGLVIVVLAIPVFLASDPEGRRIVGVLQRATATTPNTAMNAYELDADEPRTLRRLIKEGTIGETSDRRYFVNLPEVARFRRKRILAAARNDAAWLSGVITQAFSAPGGTMPKEREIQPSETPLLLKGVALFLAAWSLLFVTGSMLLFVEARVRPAPWPAAFAAADCVLAAGIWRRRPWAWWGGFVVPGVWAIAAVLPMLSNGLPDPETLPLVIIVVFRGLALVVAGVWAAWWYAQRRHFLWQKPPAA